MSIYRQSNDIYSIIDIHKMHHLLVPYQEHTVGGVLVKPDTHEAGVFQALTDDITSAGFDLIHEKDILLDQSGIISLYPDKAEHPVALQKLMEYLYGKRSTLLIAVNSLCTANDTAIDLLQRLKGNKETQGAWRQKYNTITITQQDIKLKTPLYYRYMTINNFHVFDTVTEIDTFLRMHS